MLIPTLCRPETNRLSDTFPAKMGLFRISREWKVEVCICGEPSVSPQSARAGEHFYRGEEEVGRAPTESMAFQCAESLPGNESSPSSSCWGCCCCILIYQSCQRFSTVDHMGLLEHSVVVMTALCLEGLVLFRASPILSASQGGVLSRSSPHFPEAILRGYVAGSQLYNQEMEKSRL